jgi:hypothetical protein
VTHFFQVKDALQMYAGILESSYRFVHCWLILRHENKWNTFLASLSTPNNAENDGKTVEGSKEDTLPARIERPMGRDKAKKQRSSSSSSNSTACLEVLQKMQCDRQVYEQRVEEATSVAETAIAVRAERKLGIQEEQLCIQEVLQLDQQRLEAAKNAAGIANAARADRKLAIQEEQLRVQHRMLSIQEEQQENLVMTMDLNKVTPWVRDFYTSKQKELAAKRAQRDGSTSGSGI